MTVYILPRRNEHYSKRYWVFAWTLGYACGGMGDFKGAFDTLADAKDPYHVYDVRARETHATIWDSTLNKNVAHMERLAGMLTNWKDYA